MQSVAEASEKTAKDGNEPPQEHRAPFPFLNGILMYPVPRNPHNRHSRRAWLRACIAAGTKKSASE